MSSLSVIIATCNRENILKKALRAYAQQSAPGEILEILVIDDGSTDSTQDMVANYAKSSPLPIRYFRQDHRGAGAARNIGIRECRGELILFTDDDVIPAPDLVAEHLTWHRKHPEPFVAVLGYVTWSPEIHPTPFMRWFSEEGPLLGYRELAGRPEVHFHYFYTGNLSLKTNFLRTKGTFDEDFKSYGWEDIELGYRLQKAGLRLLYNPRAIGYHLKFVSFEDACRRAEKEVEARRVYFSKEAGRHDREVTRLYNRAQRPATHRRFAWVKAGLLSLLNPLVDSPLPLPSRVYWALYLRRTACFERSFRESFEGSNAEAPVFSRSGPPSGKDRQEEHPLENASYRPLVSILTPTFNHEKYIAQCIESLLAQSYNYWEQIIIDDGSTDRTPDIVARYRDSRIKYVRQENVGILRLAETYNRALSLARGELVAILEGDDFWPPDKLETLVPALKDPQVILAYGSTAQVTPAGKETGLTIPFDLRHLPRSALFNEPVGSAARAMARLDILTYIFPSSVLIRLSSLKGIGGFQSVPGLPFVDYPTFIQLSLQGNFFFIPKIMGYWRRHSRSATWSQDKESVLPQIRDFAIKFLEEHRAQLHFSSSERQAIEQNWQYFRPRVAFYHGRILLILKRWQTARSEFRTALAGEESSLRLKATLGYCASWLHCDLEGLARLLQGRDSDLREVFDLQAERTTSEEQRG